MSYHYRINVRFDLSKEKERDAVEYLMKLSENGSKTRNRFIVNAVIDALRYKDTDNDYTLDDIRAMFREELKSASLVSEKPTESLNSELSEQQKAENDESVLAALSMFG